MNSELVASVRAAVDRERLVETACDLVAIPSFTGDEYACAEYLLGEFDSIGLESTFQLVEEGRANAIGRWRGVGEGRHLMFNGHLDTSYSGEEDWLDGPGFKPQPLVRDETILGLGIMNMKGAVACYVEAVRALQDCGISLSGDLIVAGVAGEIEKSQWDREYVGPEYRGYGSGTAYLLTHGVLADACVLGEPTEEKIALGHFGSLWGRISTSGPFIHTAFSSGRSEENSIIRMRRVIERIEEWVPEWETQAAYRGMPAAANLGAISGGFPWRASRTPHRTDLFLDIRVPPSMPMMEAVRAFYSLVRQLDGEFPEMGLTSEIYVTVPGSEIDPSHPLVGIIEESHRDAAGTTPATDYVRWGSDASALTRHGVASVNYGPISSGLPGPEGESVPIDSLVRMATSYALIATRFCGVDKT